MVLFAKCLLLFKIVVLLVAPSYGGCIDLVHECRTMVVFHSVCCPIVWWRGWQMVRCITKRVLASFWLW